jgi:hypothetical protein
MFLVIATAWVAAFGSLFSDHIFLDSYVDSDGEPFSLRGGPSALKKIMIYITLILIPVLLQFIIFVWHQCFCMVFDAWHPKVLPEYRCMARIAFLRMLPEAWLETETPIYVLRILDPVLWCCFELYPVLRGVSAGLWEEYLLALFNVGFVQMLVFIFLVFWKHLWLTDHRHKFWVDFKGGLIVVFSRRTYIDAFMFYIPKVQRATSKLLPGLVSPPPTAAAVTLKTDDDDSDVAAQCKPQHSGAKHSKLLRLVARHQNGGVEEDACAPAAKRVYWRSASAAEREDELVHFGRGLHQIQKKCTFRIDSSDFKGAGRLNIDFDHPGYAAFLDGVDCCPSFLRGSTDASSTDASSKTKRFRAATADAFRSVKREGQHRNVMLSGAYHLGRCGAPWRISSYCFRTHAIPAGIFTLLCAMLSASVFVAHPGWGLVMFFCMLFACFVLVLVERHFVYRKRVFRLLAVIGWAYVILNFAAGERESAVGVRGCFGLGDGGMATPNNNTIRFYDKHGYNAFAAGLKDPSLTKEPYQICGQQLFRRTQPNGSVDFNGLSIIDLNVFAELGYMNYTKYCDYNQSSCPHHKGACPERDWVGGCVNLTEALPTFAAKNEDPWVRVTKHRSNDASKDLVTWQEFYQPSSKTSIVAIRGTFSAWSALQDINLYTAACLYQLMLAVVPFSTGIYSDDFVARATQMAQIFRSMAKDHANLDKFGNIASYLCSIRNQGLSKAEVEKACVSNPEESITLDVEADGAVENLIVVGHSLGGALAKIMASRNAVLLKSPSAQTEAQQKLRIHAVSFSGPGQHL